MILPKLNFQTSQMTIKQLTEENKELKQKLELEFEKQVLLSKEVQEWKDKYDRVQNPLFDQEKKKLQDEIKKLRDEIKNLEISLQKQQEKTKEQINSEQIKFNSISLQQCNLELQRELEEQRQKASFIIKPKIIVGNTKQYYQLHLEWERNIQNLQLTYRQEDDSLIFDGYGESGDKKIIYQQIHNLGKMRIKQDVKPLISLKQSYMRLTFEV